MKLYVAISMLLLASATLAQADLSAKVIFPADHPLYGLQRTFEEVGRMFQFSDEAKARYSLDLADRRLGEVQDYSNRAAANPDVMNRLVSDYQKEIVKTQAFGLQISDLAKQGDVEALVQAATSHHLAVLNAVRSRLPAQSQAALDNATTVASAVQSTASQHVSQAGQQFPPTPSVPAQASTGSRGY